MKEGVMKRREAIMKRFENIIKNSQGVKDNYNCPKCRDLGYILVVDEKNYEVAIPCECLQRKEYLEKLAKCGLSDAFKKKTFKSYECNNKQQVKAKTQAMSYCNDFSNSNSSLLISGRPGSGKTHLGIASMINLIKSNIGCRYVEYNNMMISIKQSVMDEENFAREMDKYLNPKVLFIDDFLKGKATDADLKYIYSIVNSRYLKNMPLIISTEKSIKDIIDWDEAIGSRIIEMAGENIIIFDNNTENYRLNKNTIKN